MKTTDFINAKVKKAVVEAKAPAEQTPVVKSLMPEFTFESADSKFNELLEDATGGGTCSSVVATTVETLGQKGSFSKKEVNKKLGGYTNVLTRGGIVKVK